MSTEDLQSTEHQLRAELRTWADEGAADTGRDLSAAAFTALHHRRLRHRAAVLAAAAAAALVVAAVPIGLMQLRNQAPERAAAPSPTAPAAPAVDILALPPRGPLAADPALLAQYTALPWVSDAALAGRDPQASGIPDAPADTRRVLWAGDVPGGTRLVLVAGANNAVPTVTDPERQTDLGALGSTAVAVFTGPAGAAPDQLQMTTTPHGRMDGEPFAFRETATGATVVLAAPGDVVEISARPDYAADGTESRTWQAVETPDGTAAFEIDNGSAMAYRVLRSGVQVNTSEAPDATSTAPPTEGELKVLTLREPTGLPPGADPSDGFGANLLVQQTGLPADQLQLTSPWTGPLPADTDEPVTMTLTTATVPSGAVLITAMPTQWFADGSAGSSDCGQDWLTLTLPAGPPVADRTFALLCTTADMTGTPNTSLVVIAPTTAATVQLLDADGRLIDEQPLTDGTLVTTDPETVVDTVTSVEAFTADGRSLGRTGLLTAD
ncbi:hypothetical protein [Geodermatophilus sp. FMUSA9-8]|uniref:hypothetical protein n=1 Tax=Geodermatophilus sp. FMUSA9-8 TaxID=3120155 RepID=UPI00300A49C8